MTKPMKAHGTVIVEAERCKACELCVIFCPAHVLRLSPRRNSLNHRVVELVEPEGCTGCEICAKVCPDMAIVAVYREARGPERTSHVPEL